VFTVQPVPMSEKHNNVICHVILMQQRNCIFYSVRVEIISRTSQLVVMSLMGLESKNHCAGKGQRQFKRQPANLLGFKS
jgi:hypothetical protein